MSTAAPLEKVGRQLMATVAAAPDSPAAQKFDELFYPHVLRYARKRNHALGVEAARLLGQEGNIAPRLSPQQLDEAAHLTATKALESARRSAKKFDPSKGTALAWVLRAAAFAYVDVARLLAGSDRRFQDVATSDADLERLLHRDRDSEDPSEVAENHDILARYFSLLTDEERLVVLAREKFNLSYVEIAEIVFKDASAAKRVDKMLQGAREKARELANQEVL